MTGGSAQTILEPGRNCWQIVRADRASVIIDAADYYHVAREAMEEARDAIIVVGWDFDTRISLEPQAEGKQETLGKFFLRLVRSSPTLNIYVLKWSFGAKKQFLKPRAAWMLWRWHRTDRIDFHFDAAHPLGCSHHQKIVVIDDSLAVCGGIDIAAGRWDRSDHSEDEKGRVDPGGRRYKPWHDATLLASGPVAAALGELGRDRWATATGTSLLPIIFLGDACERGPALAALRARATDFLDKPLTAERLHAALDQAIAPRFQQELRMISEKFPVPLPVEEIIGSTPAFRTALAIAAKAARARVPVLIEGEAGTGKALVAAAIHHAGLRPRSPLIHVDCGHHSDAMIGPMLFGYERGAFAGAFERRVGEIVKADGGTLVLDRIERLPLDVQAALADVLASGRVQAVGGSMTEAVDVRFIACSSLSLRQRCRDGLFREDLLARIGVAEVALPPLRDRRVDIPALARHFLARIGGLPDMPALSLSGDLVTALSSWSWPGNVRQLHDALLRAACASEGPQLGLADFPGLAAERARAPEDAGHNAAMPGDGIGVTLYRSDGNLRALQDIEADVIRLAIGHYRGRMSEVARRLGIGRSTLYRKLADLGIDTAA